METRGKDYLKLCSEKPCLSQNIPVHDQWLEAVGRILNLLKIEIYTN
jgi:hypothetical protein